MNESRLENIKKKIEDTIHIPVLLNEVIENLDLNKDDVVIDGTLGGGGYAERICESIRKGILIGFDQDVDAIERVQKKIRNCKKCLCEKKFINNNFRNLDNVLVDLKIKRVENCF